jgi:hypothetical protein
MALSCSFIEGDTIEGFEATVTVPILFGTITENAVVTNSTADFPALPVPAPLNCCFSVQSSIGTVFRSGSMQLTASSAAPSFFVARAATVAKLNPNGPPPTIPPATLATMVPQTPLVLLNTPDRTVTVNSAALTVNNGSLTVGGSVTYVQRAFGGIILFSITGMYTYVFNLVPVTNCQDTGNALTVSTISFKFTTSYPGPIGGIVNVLVSILEPFFNNTFATMIQQRLQVILDNAISAGLTGGSVPANTIITSESCSIDPTNGVDPHAWVSFPSSKLCSSLPTGAPMRIRAPEQLRHLRAVRDTLLTRSPAGFGYLATFEEFNAELLRLLIADPELLELADEVVNHALRDLPEEHPEAGRITPETAEAVRQLMDRAASHAGPALRFAIQQIKPDLDRFTGRNAGEVLGEGRRLDER